MGTGVLLVVLLAAALHVTWNTLVKSAPDTTLATVAIAAGGGLWCAAALPFLPAIHAVAWWNVAGSVVAQSIYYPLVAAAYRAGDMSVAYPLMRGTAPLLVAVVSGPLIGERLGPGEWLGLGLVCLGIWGIGVGSAGARPPRRAVLLALLNAAVIAAYTLIDGVGARRSGAPATYTAWIFLFTAVPVVALALARRRGGAVLPALRHRWWVGAAGGLATVGAYGLVLWAMTRAPVATVAALRETSTLIATAVAAVWLHERVTRVRVGATVLIAAGAVVLRLA